MDPHASRETLDHSIMYIFAVALQDGDWHHIRSYLPERAQRPDTVALWNKVETKEDAFWTDRYHDPDPDKMAFGGRVEIEMMSGEILADELALANAHTLGAKPFQRSDYIRKFQTLSEGLVSEGEQDRFLSMVQNLPNLSVEQVADINVEMDLSELNVCINKGIF